MSVERRFGKREAVNLAARIEVDAGVAIDVTVRDYSHSGCRIVTNGFMRVPKQFNLQFCGGQLPDVRVEKAWQQGSEIGVSFVVADHRAGLQQPLNPDSKKLSVTDLRAMARGQAV